MFIKLNRVMILLAPVLEIIKLSFFLLVLVLLVLECDLGSSYIVLILCHVSSRRQVVFFKKRKQFGFKTVYSWFVFSAHNVSAKYCPYEIISRMTRQWRHWSKCDLEFSRIFWTFYNTSFKHCFFIVFCDNSDSVNFILQDDEIEDEDSEGNYCFVLLELNRF